MGWREYYIPGHNALIIFIPAVHTQLALVWPEITEESQSTSAATEALRTECSLVRARLPPQPWGHLLNPLPLFQFSKTHRICSSLLLTPSS